MVDSWREEVVQADIKSSSIVRYEAFSFAVRSWRARRYSSRQEVDIVCTQSVFGLWAKERS